MTPELSVQEVLTTTRSVRKRLDINRAVSRELIAECLEIAFQAPNGSNQNTWQWLVIDDRETMKKVAAIYDAALDDFINSAEGQAYQREAAAQLATDTTGALADKMRKMSESVYDLRRRMGGHACADRTDVPWPTQGYGSVPPG